MTYSAEIGRTNPICFLFLLDQSGSMQDSFGGEVQKRKAESVENAKGSNANAKASGRTF